MAFMGEFLVSEFHKWREGRGADVVQARYSLMLDRRGCLVDVWGTGDAASQESFWTRAREKTFKDQPEWQALVERQLVALSEKNPSEPARTEAQADSSLARELKSAACSGDLAQIEGVFLQDPGVSGNARAAALTCAADMGHASVVEFLLERGAHSVPSALGGGGALYAAAYRGHARVVDVLLAWEVNLDASTPGGSGPGSGWTPIMIAAAEGHESIVAALITAGAIINAESTKGRSALMFASRYGYEGIVRRLLEAGANVNHTARDQSRWSALIAAAYEGHVGTVRLLLEFGADAELRDSRGRTAQKWAKKRRHSAVEQVLRQHSQGL